MPFKLPEKKPVVPDDPEALFRDLRKKTVPGLLSHQADVLRSYIAVHTKHPDIALQLPTGSGKTLVGLLIAEWRRRKYGERVVYLCPTRQLANQVAHQASTKYGIDLYTFTGSRAQYDPGAAADWQNAEAVGVTTYSSLFNTNPFFEDPHLIILDDAHSAENYVSAFWSLLIDKSHPEHEAAFAALTGVVSRFLPPSDRSRLTGRAKSPADRQWVEILPTPAFQSSTPEIIALLDEHTASSALKHPWSLIRDSLHACHLYISRLSILIRPLIPPSNTHAPFAGATQRVYMSATLGAGGDLERVTGRQPIHKIPVPTGWDKQGIGRRFFLFPKRTLDDAETEQFALDTIKLSGRALYLVPDDNAAEKMRKAIASNLACPVFDASQIEASKAPFVQSEKAVAVVANRYDGIDLVDDDCRLLLADGLPGGANLQEKFFVLRVTAQLLLDDRILTRLVQGFGRCTRSPNDYAAVIVLGESLSSYLFKKERREFFHPEIQAELEFGLEQSKGVSAAAMLDNLQHFFAQDADWDAADKAIVALRAGMTQKTLAATQELADATAAELSYQYALWNGDYPRALEHCRTIIGKLNHPDLRGYRALWLYLAGSSAWLAHRNGQLDTDEIAKDYFRKAQAAAPVLRWLAGLGTEKAEPSRDIPVEPRLIAIVERLETVFESMGTVHDRKYDAEESAILGLLLQNSDGKAFEHGHKRLGDFLGYSAGNSSEEAAPDPWWIADDSLCLVFEDHAEGKPETVFSVAKARQAALHPQWLRNKFPDLAGTEIIPVLITPCTRTTEGAIPFLKEVRCWPLDEFRSWAKSALQALRDLRRDFPGAGNLFWRTDAVEKLKTARIAPDVLKAMLGRTAAECMEVVTAKEEEEAG
ncbi:MAG: DEAD/DEAH box helicase [Acidobacteria bacterium]|nr:DEAD/DEAH box helicase [Acidobacteriota bacterium]